MEGIKGEKGVVDPAPVGFSWNGLVALSRPEYYKVRADLPTKIELKVSVDDIFIVDDDIVDWVIVILA